MKKRTTKRKAKDLFAQRTNDYKFAPKDSLLHKYGSKTHKFV